VLEKIEADEKKDGGKEEGKEGTNSEKKKNGHCGGRRVVDLGNKKKRKTVKSAEKNGGVGKLTSGTLQRAAREETS